MNPNQTLQLYTALKLHFTTEKYDFFKYQGRLKNPVDYNKRKDKYQIEKLARQPDPKGMIIANLLDDPNAWPGSIVSETGFAVYKKWQAKMESLTYTFTEDLKSLDTNFATNFKVIDNQHPYALQLYLGDEISLETLVILNRFLLYYVKWDEELKDDVMWKSLKWLIPKYDPFLEIDAKKYRHIILEQFSDK